ncbi:MAG: squalene/phytoene synthase family protein [Pyrinomonadaceae bacterium]|nr:squalene/phytoene synthase family protein [Pyrinomonadaceae bacterium]
MMSEEVKKAYEYCESVTKIHAKSFYFAAKFLPKHKQKAVYPIYAFCRHVDDEIDEIGDGDEAEAIRSVEKWKANLKFIYENDFNEQLTANNEQTQVFIAWKDLLTRYKIPQNLPLELVQGVLMDTTIKRYETFEELYVYCYRVASTVGLMSSEILGYADKTALEYAEAMGIGMQLTNILRDVKEDAEIGRIYLPAEDLRKFGVTEKQIFEGKFDENFRQMMKFQVKRAREYYEKGEKGIPMLEQDSRFTVLLASRIYGRILDKIEKLDYNVFSARAHTNKIQKMLSIPKIWLAARKI